MRVTRLNQILGILVVASMVYGIEAAMAQHATAPPSLKTIGTPSGAMYAGAVGAAAYAAPYAYPYARPACGYYPYPPCY